MRTILKDGIKIPDFDNIANNKFLQEKVVERECPEFHQLIINKYPNINDWYEKLYLYKNMLDVPPLCPVCKINSLKFYNGKYNQYCSYKCSANSPVVRNKFKKTCEELFGCDNPRKNEDIKEKTKKTCEEKFGGPAPASSIEVLNKMKNTCEKRFGYPNICNMPEMKLQIANTLRQRHIDEDEALLGYTDDFLQIRVCSHKEKQNFNECKDCPGYFITPYNIYIARLNTEIETCTVILPIKMQGKTSIEISIENILKDLGVEYIYNCNDVIKLENNKFRQLDFYLPKLNIAIEVNGSRFHSITNKNCKKDQHIFKHNECKKRGIKLYYVWEDWFKNLNNIKEYIECIIEGRDLEKFKKLWFSDLKENEYPVDLGYDGEEIFEHKCHHSGFECFDSGVIFKEPQQRYTPSYYLIKKQRNNSC